MKETGSENMDMAVPEPCSHNQACTVNQGRVVRDFDRGARSNGKNMAVAYKDRAVFDWRICGRGINLCANQGQIRGATRSTGKKDNTQEK